MSTEPQLRPREHGAYAMLAFPLVSGLALGGVTWAGVAFATLAISGFLAHESILIVLGSRGQRLRTAQSGHARRRLTRLGLMAVVAGTGFAATAPWGAWAPTALAGGLAVGVGGLLVTGKTKTLPGEVLVAAAFSSAHGVLAAAGDVVGQDVDRVYLPAAAWTVSFTLATLAVHALKYRFKGRGPGRALVYVTPAVATVLGLSAAATVWAGHPGGAMAAALLPKVLVVVALSVLPANPRHLKRVGWSFVAADATTLALMLRASG